jgi:uncharacterized protein
MHIQLENREANAIQMYDEHHIKVLNHWIKTSVIIPFQGDIITWPVIDNTIDEHALSCFIPHTPEVIIIGMNKPHPIHPQYLAPFYQQRIGVECMSIGAACRTFNILLSEGRKVFAGFVIKD